MGQSVPKPSPLRRCPDADMGVDALWRTLIPPMSCCRGLILPWPDLDAAGVLLLRECGAAAGLEDSS